MNRDEGKLPVKWLLAIALLLAFCGKLYLLNLRSTYIDPDEAYYLTLARNIYEGRGFTFNGLTHVHYPPFLPIVVGALNLILGNIVLSLNALTALAGCLLGLVCYAMVKRRNSSEFALCAALLVLTAYQLNAFFPRLVPYTAILYRGSDIVGCLLVYTGLLFTLKVADSGSCGHGLVAGLAFASAYLTRPEGLIIYSCAFLFLVYRLYGNRSVSPKGLIAFLLGFALLAIPYFLFLHSVFGCWRLTGKTEAHLFSKTMPIVIEKDDWKPFSKVHYAFDKKRLEMSSSFWGFISQAPPLFLVPQTESIKASLRSFWCVPSTLLTPALYLLLPFGLFVAWQRWKKKEKSDDLLFLALPFTSAVIFVATYPVPRHHLFWVPASLLYSLEGVKYLCGKAEARGMDFKRMAFLLGVLLLVSSWYDYSQAWRANLLLEPSFRQFHETTAQIGKFLQSRNKGPIMSRLADVAVRAETDWQVRPDVDMPTLLRFARKKGVRYIEMPIPIKPGRAVIEVEKSAKLKDGEPWQMVQVKTKEPFALVRVLSKQNSR